MKLTDSKLELWPGFVTMVSRALSTELAGSHLWKRMTCGKFEWRGRFLPQKMTCGKFARRSRYRWKSPQKAARQLLNVDFTTKILSVSTTLLRSSELKATLDRGGDELIVGSAAMTPSPPVVRFAGLKATLDFALARSLLRRELCLCDALHCS